MYHARVANKFSLIVYMLAGIFFLSFIFSDCKGQFLILAATTIFLHDLVLKYMDTFTHREIPGSYIVNRFVAGE